jgi:hypothetical protein
VLGDPGQVEQAIINLAVNARDAMPSGGRLTLETTVIDVDEAFAKTHVPMTTGRYTVLRVTDTGHGMSPETTAHIFEPFFTTKDVGKGTGLGLSMVYGTLKQIGGFIFVDSVVGHGTTFSLFFRPAQSGSVAARSCERRPRDGGEHVVGSRIDGPSDGRLTWCRSCCKAGDDTHSQASGTASGRGGRKLGAESRRLIAAQGRLPAAPGRVGGRGAEDRRHARRSDRSPAD